MSRPRPTAHRIVVLAAVVLGTLALAAATPAAAVPAAPTALTANFGSGNVVLAWTDNSLDETGFSIERCLGASCTAFGQIATVGAGVTSYADSYYATGTSRYRVRAFNGAGFSSYSNTADLVLVSTGDVTPRITAAPTSGHAPLTVSFDGSASSSLNGTITSYTWSFGDNQTATGAQVAHAYSAPGVYAASLRVTSGGIFPSAGSTAVVITVTAPPLVAPSDLGATSPARRQVLLTWTNPVSSATSLAVERCKGSGCTTFARIAVLAASVTSYTDTTVKSATTYTYRLAASDGTGTAYSNTVSVTARR